MIQVLYVDDDKELLEVGKAFLETSEELQVDTCHSVSEAEERLSRSRYEAVISDYQMPRMNGIDFLKKLRSRGNHIPFILFTGRGREEVVIEALNSGADFYLQKGGDPTVQFAELEHKVRESVRRSRAERALRENEERLTRAQALGLMGCWEFQWDSEVGRIWASEEGSRLFGLTASIDGFLSLEEVEACILERERVHQALVDLIEKGAKYDLEYEIAPADGGPHRIIHSVAKLVRDRESLPLKVVGTIQNITDRMSIDEQLTSAKLTLAIAMDSARFVYWEYDIGTDTYTFNDQFYAMYGTTADREGGYLMSKKDYYDRFVHPDDTVYCREVSAKAPEYHGSNLHIEHRVIRRDGSVIFISVYPCQIKDEHGTTVKVFGVNQDITELKMAEENLRKANEKLGLLSSITRHDISNQLTIQMGQLALLRGKVSDPDISNRIQKIESSVVTVQKQIEFTGDYEKMGVSSPQWQSVEELLDNLPNLKDVGRLEVDESVQGLSVFADPMLHKVLHNLIENSVKYGGKPCAIRIHCEAEGENLLLVYEDVGFGISREDKDKLFQKGFGKGTGLGLFLSREILAITGIDISESGRPGDGARFEMRVPLGQYRFDRADMAGDGDLIAPDQSRQQSKPF